MRGSGLAAVGAGLAHPGLGALDRDRGGAADQQQQAEGLLLAPLRLGDPVAGLGQCGRGLGAVVVQGGVALLLGPPAGLLDLLLGLLAAGGQFLLGLLAAALGLGFGLLAGLAGRARLSASTPASTALATEAAAVLVLSATTLPTLTAAVLALSDTDAPADLAVSAALWTASCTASLTSVVRLLTSDSIRSRHP